MNNSARGPLIGALAAIILAAVTTFLWYYRGADAHYSVDATTTNWVFIVDLNPVEIALSGLALTLGIYSAIGLFSYFLDGKEVHIGRFAPNLSDGVAAWLAVSMFATAVCAVLFAIGVVLDWNTLPMGVIVGVGFILAAFVLAFYKRGFVGEDGRFDDREDGIPW